MSTDPTRMNNTVPQDVPGGWAMFSGVMMFGLGTMALTMACAELFNNSIVAQYSVLATKVDWYWYGIFDVLSGVVAFEFDQRVLERILEHTCTSYELCGQLLCVHYLLNSISLGRQAHKRLLCACRDVAGGLGLLTRLSCTCEHLQRAST